ncbi:type I-B CRISPR-associated endonuclease Cas1b [Enterococcus avium]|uniref:type I-B CRISPR-associated endonuclease Cas1b n=1 Tax=Enterococcus avium TaxID=33945 RepID=UPI0028924385|nr:type I-B CRISPR-associated endonuclease Cas1b [Enterococcus avium]MDT2425711.1 type I-B CRISPR-associated endonuclease Cas1b [Enterococcus avium]MDT2457151.1 type I-B CRISPR-associated endonuclease Cas1b [Enterococcus avium]
MEKIESYYLYSSGTLSRKDNVIRMETADGRKKDLKIEMTRDIYLFGEVTTNTKCLNYLSEMKIPVHFFNYYGYYTGTFYPREKNVSGKLLVQQVYHSVEEEKRIILARKFVDGATANCLRNLQYYRRRGKEVERQITEIEAVRKRIPRTNEVEELMGLEGNIHQIYYSAWETIFNDEIEFKQRVRRPPDNMVNTLISYLNMLTYSACLSEIYVSQLNPTISYLHSNSERRFSLSLDIAEIFKPLIVDRLIFSLINKKIITEKDFETGSNGNYLKQTGQQKVLRQFDERLNKTIRHRELKRNVSYRKLMRLECYKLIKHLMSDKEYEPFKIWW